MTASVSMPLGGVQVGSYDGYEQAQAAVDYLSDEKFAVENVTIIGTDLRMIETVTGRLTTGRVALGGLLSGIWMGLFIGLIFSFFGTGSALAVILSTVVIGALFGIVWALAGYAATRGRRDFSSVSRIVATRYEVLVEHKLAAQGRELLTQLPGHTASQQTF